MSNLNQIAKGFVNSITNKNDDLFKERMKICRTCPLLKQDSIFGDICNSSLYCNPKTLEVSKTPKLNFFNGCGCILRSKTRVPEAHCPLSRW